MLFPSRLYTVKLRSKFDVPWRMRYTEEQTAWGWGPWPFLKLYAEEWWLVMGVSGDDDGIENIESGRSCRWWGKQMSVDWTCYIYLLIVFRSYCMVSWCDPSVYLCEPALGRGNRTCVIPKPWSGGLKIHQWSTFLPPTVSALDHPHCSQGKLGKNLSKVTMCG